MIRTFEPGGTRRATSSAVIIFVSEAIGSTRVGSRRHSTRPVSRSNMRPERGGRLKRRDTRSRGSSSRTDSGDGAVPPPASGAGAPSARRDSGGSATGLDGAGSRSDVRKSAAATPQAITTSIASRAGQRRRLRFRPPWKTW